MSAALKRVFANPTDSGDPKRLQVVRRAATGGLGPPFRFEAARGLPLELGIFLQPGAGRRGTTSHYLLAGLELDPRRGARGVGHRARRSASVVGDPAHHARAAGSRARRSAYVEVFRNIPLLVQMFLWYFVLPELLPPAVGDCGQAAAAALGLVRARRALPLGSSPRRASPSRCAPGSSRCRAGQRKAGTGAGPDAGADLPLRAAADGLPHHRAAAHSRVPQHLQELVGRAHHRADRAHRARARDAGIQLPDLRGVRCGDPDLPARPTWSWSLGMRVLEAQRARAGPHRRARAAAGGH